MSKRYDTEYQRAVEVVDGRAAGRFIARMRNLYGKSWWHPKTLAKPHQGEREIARRKARLK